MPETSEHYETEYAYYQYNSGAADNGEYTSRTKRASAEEAITLAEKINASARKEPLDTEEERLLLSELIPWDGYFLWSRACRVVTAREPLTR